MAGRDYSHRAVIDKLNIKDGARVLLLGLNDPALLEEIRTRTSDCSLGGRKKNCDVILFGAESTADLQKVESFRELLAAAGGLWIVYPNQALLMFRNLLTARFQMHLMTEERSVAVYSLVVTSRGSKLKPTDSSANSVSGGTFEIAAPAMNMSDLARRLSTRTGRPVIDGTRLQGNYEIRLTWGPDSDDGTALNNLFHALRDQLGLELKATKTNMKIYVVDKASKTPSENEPLFFGPGIERQKKGEEGETQIDAATSLLSRRTILLT